jgi:hypothetical protein
VHTEHGIRLTHLWSSASAHRVQLGCGNAVGMTDGSVSISHVPKCSPEAGTHLAPRVLLRSLKMSGKI